MLSCHVQLAERIHVRKAPALSILCHRAKNLYNLANFYVRQELFRLESVLTYYDLDFMLHKQSAYQALPAQTAAYNIIQQAVPEAFADGIEGVGLHPVLVGLA